MTAGSPKTLTPTKAGLVAHGIMDLLVVALVFVGGSELARWGWSAAELAALISGWAGVAVLSVWMKMRGRGWASVVELVAGMLVLLAVGVFRSSGQGSVAQQVYGLSLVAITLTGWRGWRRRSEAVQDQPVAESARVLLVALAALWPLLPMFTDRFTGGTDARWYAYMLHDFIEQWRAHGPPVFLGQGDLVWVGAVHPFRSAPVYMHLAGLWDWLTFQALGTGALQHLTAITAVLAGAWGVYASGVKLAPQRRWESAAIAALYALCPAVLMTLYIADAYMTFIAAAAFVWVFYGNVRVLTEGRGWLCLAASLSLTWMCHPPTAMQVTLLSAVLQMGGMALGPAKWAEWRKVLGAGVVFALLSLHYFTGMSELPRAPETDLKSGLLQVMALPLGWFVGVRVFVLRREWWWLLLLAPVAAILWLTCRIWLGWLGLTLVFLGLVAAGGRRWSRFAPADYAPLLLLICVLGGAASMDWALRAGWVEAGSYPAHSQQLWSDTWADNYFKPLTPQLRTEGDYQPGWGLWLAGLAAGLAACRRGARVVQLVFGALVLMVPLLLHWPRVGDFMLEHFPRNLVNMTGLAMELRVMPVFAVLLATGGLLVLRETRGVSGAARWLAGLILLLAVGWAGWQARLFLHRGHLITTPRGVSATDWRPENAPMDMFVYDLLPLPSYYSHGKMDPRLEVRLLDDRGNLIYGPPHITEAMEEAGAQTLSWDTHAITGHPDWLQLEPRFELQPGEHRLFRFEFDPARSYSGYLILRSEHGYREYILPESGQWRSFGTGPAHSRVLSLWNSGTDVEHYEIQFLLKSGHDLQPGMHFATVRMSAFQPERALIRLESLNPWRVRTSMPWSGQLETPRVFLPGYEVKVDGRRVGGARISASPERLLQIAMPPGEHVVEVNYVGTLKLRIAGLISLAAWAGVLIWLAGRRKAPAAPEAF